MTYWNLALWALAAAFAIPMLIWAIECTAALVLAPRKPGNLNQARPSVTILVAAHNEAGGIRRTLESLFPQISARDSVVVIADNCTDETANIARECGATVVERRDPARRGKCYAMEFGVRSLDSHPADIVIVVDADCIALPDAISHLALTAFRTGRPAQASYYLESPLVPEPHRQLAALAFLIKNVVRPGGLARLGGPCFLNGSGMAFPSTIIRSIDWANGRLAEDYWATVDIALAGHLPVFCEESRICSRLPGQNRALATQHTRWIQGHLESMLAQGPRLLLRAVKERRPGLLVLALDNLVPPFSLLILGWLTGFAITATAGLLGAALGPATLLAACGLWSGVLFIVLTQRFGRVELRKALAEVPRYMLSRVPLLAAFVFGRQRNWIPTARDPQPSAGAATDEETSGKPR